MSMPERVKKNPINVTNKVDLLKGFFKQYEDNLRLLDVADILLHCWLDA